MKGQLMKENSKNLVYRYLMFILGVAVNSFGIAFITKSSLGTSQISSVPYVLSLKFTRLTFGEWSFLMNLVFILLQVILLKKDFKPFQYLQVVVDILFSAVIDGSMLLLSNLNPQTLPAQILCALAGCAILGFGITIEVKPNVLVVPGEGVVGAISAVSGKRFGTVKVIFDLTLIAISVTMSIIFFHRLVGVGLGTVISALTVGQFINFFNRHLPFDKLKFLSEEKPEQTKNN